MHLKGNSTGRGVKVYLNKPGFKLHKDEDIEYMDENVVIVADTNEHEQPKESHSMIKMIFLIFLI